MVLGTWNSIVVLVKTPTWTSSPPGRGIGKRDFFVVLMLKTVNFITVASKHLESQMLLDSPFSGALAGQQPQWSVSLGVRVTSGNPKLGTTALGQENGISNRQMGNIFTVLEPNIKLHVFFPIFKIIAKKTRFLL